MDVRSLATDPRLAATKSQLKQDLFVLSELELKRGGFFVEFGATNGVDINNTWLMEKQFGWNGILAEPSKHWHNDLFQNRSCYIDTKCVWSSTGQKLVFNEVNTQGAAYGPELSTIDSFSSVDNHAGTRRFGQKYEVETISLMDLLSKYQAPRLIDYMSVDTEGSEFEILDHFDFDAYDVRIITVEHNYTPMREKLFELLVSKGYARKFESISQWDDWYVKV